MSCHNSLIYIKERSVGRAKYLIKHRCNRWGRAETADQTSKYSRVIIPNICSVVEFFFVHSRY